MKNIILNKINPLELNTLQKLTKVYVEAGYSLYLVGGAIRDALLNKDIKDLDLATDAPLSETKKLFKKIVETGEDHGTLTVLEDGYEFEITRFRKDVATDGRNATIEFASTIQEDVERRDLTINGMALNLETFEFIDLFNGCKDIKDRKINFILKAKDRILEDHLRSVRFLRFLVKYPDFISSNQNFEDLERYTNLNKVSVERINDELTKIMSYNSFPSTKVIDMFIKIGGLKRYGFKLDAKDSLIKSIEMEDFFPLILQNYYENKENINKTFNNMKFDKDKYRDLINFYKIYQENKNDKFLYHKYLNLSKNWKIDYFIESLSIVYKYLDIKLDKEKLIKLNQTDIRISDLNINGEDLINLDIEPKERAKTLDRCLKFVWLDNSNNDKDILIDLIKNKSNNTSVIKNQL